MNKKDLVIAVLTTFCLTSSLFMISVTRSAMNPYDPWLDYDEDGRIGLTDLVIFAQSYGETGDPTKNVNVTNWPEGWLQGSFEARLVYNQSIGYVSPGVDYNRTYLTSIDVTGYRNIAVQAKAEGTWHHTDYQYRTQIFIWGFWNTYGIDIMGPSTELQTVADPLSPFYGKSIPSVPDTIKGTGLDFYLSVQEFDATITSLTIVVYLYN